MGRDEAYRVVQRAAQRAFDEGAELRDLLAAEAPDLDLDAVFDTSAYLKHVPEVFERLEDFVPKFVPDSSELHCTPAN